ncbi:MAG: Gfo/Idh/MocA family oxidoreductase [Armatimonadetes bacterium]|nr:Gfo/Idh/MocA family oxidoreductase [Armatimonadota bacterium]
MEQRTWKVGVIGVAGIGRTHLAAYEKLSREAEPLCALEAACDIHPAALEKAREEFGVPKAYADYRSLLEDPEVEVVSLCVPHFLHRPMALEILAAGKHLLLEKPVGLNYGEAAEIAAAARESRGAAGVIFQSRFDPRVRFVREHVIPVLGKIRYASSREYHWRGADYYAGAPWRGTWTGEGGGLFINQCIHGWDLMGWLLGGVDYAYGFWANLLHPSIEVEDIGYGVVQFRGPDGSGVPARTVATTCLPTPPVTDRTPWERKLSIQITGEHGEVIANDFRAPRNGFPMADFRLEDPRLDRELHEAMEAEAREADRYGHAADHRTNIRAHLEALRGGQPAPVTLESAAEVQKIIDGIHWHGWFEAGRFREWAHRREPLPRDADEDKAAGWDGGGLWRLFLQWVDQDDSRGQIPFHTAEVERF